MCRVEGNIIGYNLTRKEKDFQLVIESKQLDSKIVTNDMNELANIVRIKSTKDDEYEIVDHKETVHHEGFKEVRTV